MKAGVMPEMQLPFMVVTTQYTPTVTDHLSIVQAKANLGEVHGKVARWMNWITELKLEYHHT